MLYVCCLHVTHKLISVATLTYIDQEFSKIFVYVFVDLKDRVKDGKRELPYDSSAPQVACRSQGRASLKSGALVHCQSPQQERPRTWVICCCFWRHSAESWNTTAFRTWMSVQRGDAGAGGSHLACWATTIWTPIPMSVFKTVFWKLIFS